MSQNSLPPPPSGANARKPDAPKPPLRKRAYTLSLSFSGLLTAVIVLLIGVSWVFMLGVMVGRGHNPEEKLDELAGRVLRGRQTPGVQDPPQGILRAEELHFGAALRDKPLQNSTAAVGTPAPQASAAQPAPQAASRGAQAEGAVVSKAAGNAPATQPATQAAPRGAQPARFDVVYQTAAFRDAGQADRLRERLEGEGVRTALETSPAKGGRTLYKVLALRRGTEEDDKQLLAVLERLHLGRPLLRSKKPVGTGTK